MSGGIRVCEGTRIYKTYIGLVYIRVYSAGLYVYISEYMILTWWPIHLEDTA